MTETISHVALQKLNGIDKQGSFFPLPSITIRQDERTCLIIHAPHVSDKEIITNDLVEIKPDHSFKVIGRWDNVINSGGVKIIPEKVEDQISKLFAEHKIKNDFFIAPLADSKLGQTANLIIEGELENVTKLQSDMKDLLHKYELPKQMFFLKKFIRTESGKINRTSTVNLLPVRPL
jgi:o-succinylbenzoate---CoA ligase